MGMRRIRTVVVLGVALVFLFAAGALAGPVLDRIQQKGELVIGTSGTQPPLTAKTKDGKIIGFDADLSRLMAGAMGVKLKMVEMSFPDLLPALQTGKVDMVISGMTMTPERNLKVVFVGPYFVSGKGILTKAQKMASMQGAKELNKKEVTLAALKASTSQLFVETLIPDAKLMATKDLDEAMNLLFEDKVDALVADYPFCAVAAFRYRDKGLIAGSAQFTYEPLGIAVPEGDPLLINWIENFLSLLNGKGDLKLLGERWFKDASWVEQLP